MTNQAKQRTVALASICYKNKDGHTQRDSLGTVVQVHVDDVARFDKVNIVDGFPAPPAVELEAPAEVDGSPAPPAQKSGAKAPAKE